ncbi:unnamed protein product [Adineta ricciae]|uniref:Uncharacterized protein n=1 Tax=Adineta ricciae TaxID=249248 RepID=A0A815LY33_ADIRI|nr:unnamed protein product [Adineta ricciae]
MSKLLRDVLPAPQTYCKENCSCATQPGCSKSSIYSFPNFNGSLVKSIRGFRFGCRPLDAYLQSGFACLYGETCIGLLENKSVEEVNGRMKRPKENVFLVGLCFFTPSTNNNASNTQLIPIINVFSGITLHCQPQIYRTDHSPKSFVTSDFSTDFILDLVVTNYEDHTLNVLLGNGLGRFQNHGYFIWNDYFCYLTYISGILDMAVGNQQTIYYSPNAVLYPVYRNRKLYDIFVNTGNMSSVVEYSFNRRC